MDISTADTFFAAHLGGAAWAALDAAAKAAALAMAEDDVAVRLGLRALDETRPNQSKAVCEQALYLAQNYAEISKPRDILSETIEGAWQTNYQLPADRALSPRAQLYIDRERAGRGVRFGRG